METKCFQRKRYSTTVRGDRMINLNWITIDKSSRGNGYASAALSAAKEFGKATGVKKMTLEVPGNAPDARHIYEKLGFKVIKEADRIDPVWGGLTEMEYNFNTAKHSQTDSIENFLDHHGVKGQKWGVRKKESSSASSTKGPNPKHLSDAELKSAIDRMRLEQQYTELANPRKKSGGAFAKSILENSGRILITAVVGAVGTIGVGKAFGASIARTEAAKEIAKAAAIKAAAKAAGA